MNEREQKQREHTINYSKRHHADALNVVRSGLGDAAGLCDAIEADILNAYTVRGRVTKEGRALAAIAKRCGDAIWKTREEIK